MNLKITAEQLKQAATARRKGFAEAVLAIAGQEDGKIVIHVDDWHRLTRAHLKRPIAGPGDLVAVVAKPVARAIDRITARMPWLGFQTRLAECSACDRRRVVWNETWQRFWGAWSAWRALLKTGLRGR